MWIYSSCAWRQNIAGSTLYILVWLLFFLVLFLTCSSSFLDSSPFATSKCSAIDPPLEQLPSSCHIKQTELGGSKKKILSNTPLSLFFFLSSSERASEKNKSKRWKMPSCKKMRMGLARPPYWMEKQRGSLVPAAPRSSPGCFSNKLQQPTTNSTVVNYLYDRTLSDVSRMLRNTLNFFIKRRHVECQWLLTGRWEYKNRIRPLQMLNGRIQQLGRLHQI